MSGKPKALVKDSNGKVVPNRLARAGRNLRGYGNPELVKFALQQITDDVETGGAHRGRYSRVRDAIVARFNCSHDTAENAIRGARAYTADVFAAEREVRVPEVCAQLQKIADENQQADPKAAVAALREISRMIGAYAPHRVDVSCGIAPTLQLRAVIGVLDDDGRAALEVVLAQVDAAKAAGLLTSEENIEDAEIVDAN